MPVLPPFARRSAVAGFPFPDHLGGGEVQPPLKRRREARPGYSVFSRCLEELGCDCQIKRDVQSLIQPLTIRAD